MTRAALLFVLATTTARPGQAQGAPTVQRLFGSGVTQFEHFGWAVAVATGPAGTLAVVSAEQDGLPLGRGSAFVYHYDTQTGLFAEEARLQASESADQGQAVAVLPGPDAAPERALAVVGGGGTAYLYRRAATGGTWVRELGPVDLPGNTFEAGGYGVGLVRDTAGAEYMAVSDGDSVFVYRRPPGSPMAAGSWALDGALGSGPEGLSATIVAAWSAPDGSVGAAVADRGAQPLEIVVFRRAAATGVWSEEARLTGSAARPGDAFGEAIGASVGTDGVERVVVGSPYRPNTFPVPPGGAAYVFARDGATGAWAEEARLVPPSPQFTFGRCVAISGSVVAAYGSDVATVYRRTGGAWSTTGSFNTNTYGAFAQNEMALSGSFLLMGDDLNGDFGAEAGGAWAFTLPEAWTPAEPGAPPSVALAVSVWPNPARSRVTVSVALAAAGAVAVAVYDGLGRRVALVHDGVLPAGVHALSLDGASLPAGLYVVRAVGTGVAASRILAVVR